MRSYAQTVLDKLAIGYYSYAQKVPAKLAIGPYAQKYPTKV